MFYLLYFFYICILCSAVMVVTSYNPIHSVLFLVLVFFWGSGIVFMLRLDFVALIFIMIYAGAIAVLFLFVIMMLNVKLMELSSVFLTYLPVGIFLVLAFALEFFIYFYAFWGMELGGPGGFSFTGKAVDWVGTLGFQDNIFTLGAVLYSYYGFLVVINAYILLVAMISSVFLTFSAK